MGGGRGHTEVVEIGRERTTALDAHAVTLRCVCVDWEARSGAVGCTGEGHHAGDDNHVVN